MVRIEMNEGTRDASPGEPQLTKARWWHSEDTAP